MLELLQESQVNGKRQQFTARPLDGESEGKGLALTIEHDGQQADVTMNEEEAREFAEWCMDHTTPNAKNEELAAPERG